MSPNLPVVLAVLPGVVVGLLLPLAIVGLVAYGIVELVRAGADRPVGGGDGVVPGAAVSPVTSPAITILDERFARGEIDTEDYVQRRELLLASTATPVAADPELATDAPPTATATLVGAGADEPADLSAAVAPSTPVVPPVVPEDEATGEQPSTGS